MKKRSIRLIKAFGILFILFIATIIFLMKSKSSLSGKIKDGLISLVTRSTQSSNVPKIEVAVVASHQPDYTFLDSREKKEYKVSHIKNSIYVGDHDFSIDSISQFPKDVPIVVYCSVGIRSDHIAKKIIDAGYTNVHNMEGGIFKWMNDGHPVFDSSGNTTQNIHAFSKMWGMLVRSDHKIYK